VQQQQHSNVYRMMVAHLAGLSLLNLDKGSFRLIRAALALVALLLGVLARSAPAPGDRLEAFTMASSGGKPVQWRPGRVTVLSCMAFWCDTWKTQAPRLDQARKESGVLPVDFIQIIVDGRYSKYLGSTPFEYWLDRDGSWSRSHGIDRIPYTFVVDAKGTVRWAAYGIVRSDLLSAEIRKAFQPANTGGVVYLTFDDYPNRGSDDLLDILRAEGVNATFFCIGVNAVRQKAAVERAISEGHSVQMHSWDHNAAKPELDRLQRLLREFGGHPALYRPPGSEFILREGKRLEARVVNPYDFAGLKTEELMRRILYRVSNGSVIQLHAGALSTQKALAGIIRALKSRGYRFDVMK